MNTTAVETKAAGKRAAALADRIVEGAELLASFAEGLTDAEWSTPVSPTDKRTVGVIVHHVASMYPIEIGAVRAIAGGNAVTEVTWDVVAQINATTRPKKPTRRKAKPSSFCGKTVRTRPMLFAQ
jgi:hypothetical protein